eukprot:913928-Rhodomonas_salina.1
MIHILALACSRREDVAQLCFNRFWKHHTCQNRAFHDAHRGRHRSSRASGPVAGGIPIAGGGIPPPPMYGGGGPPYPPYPPPPIIPPPPPPMYGPLCSFRNRRITPARNADLLRTLLMSASAKCSKIWTPTESGNSDSEFMTLVSISSGLHLPESNSHCSFAWHWRPLCQYRTSFNAQRGSSQWDATSTAGLPGIRGGGPEGGGAEGGGSGAWPS